MADRKESETDSTASSKGEEEEEGQDVWSDAAEKSDHLMDSLLQAHRSLTFGPMSNVGEAKGANTAGASESSGGRVLEDLFRSARQKEQQQQEKTKKEKKKKKKGGKPKFTLAPDIVTDVAPGVSGSTVTAGVQQTAPPVVPKPYSLLASGGMMVQELEEMQHHPHRFKYEEDSSKPPPPQQEETTAEQKEPATEESSPGAHHFVPIQPSGSSTQGSSPSQSAENSPGEPLILMTPSDFERRSYPSSREKERSRERHMSSRMDMFLTPQAFASPLHSVRSTPNLSSLRYESQNSFRWRERENASFLSSPPLEVQPLTRSQFQQAVIHMIRTDAEFLDRLYDAYITSFRNKKNASSKR